MSAIRIKLDLSVNEADALRRAVQAVLAWTPNLPTRERNQFQKLKTTLDYRLSQAVFDRIPAPE